MESQSSTWVDRLLSRLPPARTISRVVSAPLALGSGAVLALSAWLEPNPLGHSTHTALGLGQCSFLAISGYPCPMCGMTTSFALFAHLHPIDAVVNQPFSAVMFGITALVFGVSAAEVVAPRERWARLGGRLAPWEATLATGFLIAMGLGWLYKIVMMKFI